MADTTYSVLCDFQAHGVDTLRSAAGALASSFGEVASAAATIGTIALGGMTAAIGAAAYGVVGLNAELEKTTMSLAAIFSANGATNGVAQGMTLAADMMSKMRRDAAALPGEFSDLVGIFKMIQIPGLRAGADPERLEKLASNIMAAGASAGLDMHMVAREAGQLVAGHAGAHNILGSTLFGLQGDQAKAFNQKGDTERLKWLEANMGKYQEAIGLFGNSYDAISSTLVDNAKLFMGSLSGPLFDRVKGALSEVNAWFDANRVEIGIWTEAVGGRIADAFDTAVSHIHEWMPAIATFTETLYTSLASVWQRVEPFALAVEEHMLRAMTDPAVMTTAKHLAEAAMAMRAVSGFAGLAGAAAGTAGGGLGVEALAVSAAVSIPALLAMAGAIDSVTDGTATFHKEAFDAYAGLRANASSLDATLSQLASNIYQNVEPGLREVADMFGTGLLVALKGMSDAALFAAKHTELVTTALSSMFGSPALKVIMDYVLRPHLNPDSDLPNVNRDADIAAGMPTVVPSLLKAVENAKPKVGAGHGGGGTSIQKVEIVVSSSHDPARIARQVFTELDYVKRHPRVSNARNWSE